MFRRIIVVLVAVAFLQGCTTIKGWLQSDKKKADAPAELVEITNGVKINKAWSVSVGGEGRKGLRQMPATDGVRVFAATNNGELVAYDLNTGKKLWSEKVSAPAKSNKILFWRDPGHDGGLSSTPATGSGMVVIGDRNGQVIAVDAETGATRWSTEVSAEIIAAPLITDGKVIVRASDGRVFGLNATDGVRGWVFDRGIPNLSVRGNSAPVATQGLVLVGNDDGSVIALRAEDGMQIWEQYVVQAEGRTELERMADIDGEIKVGASSVYATSFYGESMAIDLASGQALWTRETGSYAGLELLSDRLILADKAGSVWALDRSNGSSLWRQESLARRWLTTPTLHGDYVVLGDVEGYLHWLNTSDGSLVARQRVDREPIRATPLSAPNGMLIVVSVEGKMAAYTLAQ